MCNHSIRRDHLGLIGNSEPLRSSHLAECKALKPRGTTFYHIYIYEAHLCTALRNNGEEDCTALVNPQERLLPSFINSRRRLLHGRGTRLNRVVGPGNQFTTILHSASQHLIPLSSPFRPPSQLSSSPIRPVSCFLHALCETTSQNLVVLQ